MQVFDCIYKNQKPLVMPNSAKLSNDVSIARNIKEIGECTSIKHSSNEPKHYTVGNFRWRLGYSFSLCGSLKNPKKKKISAHYKNLLVQIGPNEKKKPKVNMHKFIESCTFYFLDLNQNQLTRLKTIWNIRAHYKNFDNKK